jgi:hypothetical protein
MPSKTASSFRKPLSGPLGTSVFVGAMLLTAYFAWTYSGLYRWFAELQIARTGEFHPKVTLLFTFCVLIVPATIAISLGRYISQQLLGNDATDSLANASDHEAQTVGRSIAPSGETHVRTRRIHGKPWCAVFAVVLWIAGGAVWFAYKPGDALSQTTIEAWESGQAPPTQWVNLHGKALAKAAITYGNPGTGEVYIPVISNKWRAGQSVKVFLKCSEINFKKGNVATALDHEGIVEWWGMPGPVRARFERYGVIPADDYVIIGVGASPETRRKGAIFLITVGCVAMVMQCVYTLMHSVRNTRRPTQAVSQ